MTISHEQKLAAYTAQMPINLTNREIDARALLNTAARLQKMLDEKAADKKAYMAAVRLNQRLWTIFQVALCDPENPLATEIKINLLSLSRYVDRVSFRVVTHLIPDQIQSLIEINRIIAAGLMKTPPNAEPKPPAVEIPKNTQPMSVATSA